MELIRAQGLSSGDCLLALQMLQDFVDDFRLSDIGNDAQLPSAKRAGCDIDLKYSFQAVGPGEGRAWLMLAGFGGIGDFGWMVIGFVSRSRRFGWDDVLAMLEVGCEHPVVAGEVRARSGHESGESGEEVCGLKHEMGGAI